MTRILAELLGAHEPSFRHGIARLERASGHPNHDIRLTSDIVRATKGKLQQLGLDPQDTTGEELYAALVERLKQDDLRVQAALHKLSSESETLLSVTHVLRIVPLPRSCFALKNQTAKRLLTKQPPKKVMKALGYRSLASMLKHEPVAQLFAAAWSLESETWRKRMFDSYRGLQAGDFETREMTILAPTDKRWQSLAVSLSLQLKHTVITLREFGAVIVLPVPNQSLPPVAAITTLVLGLQAMNDIRSAGTFLKLYQVKAHFGTTLQKVVAGEPALSSDMLDEPIPWSMVQRYYARFRDAFRADVFEPHIQAEDLSWHNIERVLEHIEPSLAFWRGTEALSLLHLRMPVSCNIADVALSCCNNLPYTNRIVHHVRQAQWHELLLRYLKHDTIEQTIVGQLQLELVPEPALI